MLSTNVSDPLPMVTGVGTGGAAICAHGPEGPVSEYQLPAVFS